MSAAHLAEHLSACGFPVRLWRDKRIYILGYGRDLQIYVEPALELESGPNRPADGALIVVTSSWRSPHAGLRCKGVKHALLCDLYKAGLVSESPPVDWRQVRLDDRAPTRPIIIPLVDAPAS